MMLLFSTLCNSSLCRVLVNMSCLSWSARQTRREGNRTDDRIVFFVSTFKHHEEGILPGVLNRDACVHSPSLRLVKYCTTI